MKIRTPWNGGEVGVIHCNLGDVPVLRLLQARCPNMRVEVILGDGKRNSLIALADINFDNNQLTELNKEVLPHVSDLGNSDLGGLARRHQ